MSNSRRRNRLSLTPNSSLPLSNTSPNEPRPASRDSVTINGQQGSWLRPVKSSRQSLQLSPDTPTMFSGPAASDLPLIVFSQSRGGQTLLTPQPLPGRPHTSHYPPSRSRTLSERERKITKPPKPKYPSPDLFLPTPSELQKHSLASRIRRTPKHRASIDVTSATNCINPADGVESKRVTELPKRSSWAHKRGQASVGGSVRDGESYLDPLRPLPEPLPEKHRVMNVRRAKKMQQVFGSEPPQSLFQITHVSPTPVVGGEAAEVFDDRASVSTLLSTSTVNLQSPKYTSGRERRVSASSTLMWSTPPLTPTTPVLSPMEIREPALPRFEQSFTPDTPWLSDPPFSHVVRSPTQTTVVVGGVPQTTRRVETSTRRKERDFRQRRVRAAKLTKFFGVHYNDLEPHLASGEGRPDIPKLEVAIDNRGPLPWDRPEIRNLEMEDVIVRLRDLRSS